MILLMVLLVGYIGADRFDDEYIPALLNPASAANTRLPLMLASEAPLFGNEAT